MLLILSRPFGLAKKLIWNSVFWVVAFAIFVFGLYILNYSIGWLPALGSADPNTPDLIEGLTVAGLLVTIFALLVRLWFAKRNDESTQKNLHRFRRSDRSTRFNAAVSQLANLETALGGFYGIMSAVEDKDPNRSDDNEEYTKQALKIMCSYIRATSERHTDERRIERRRVEGWKGLPPDWINSMETTNEIQPPNFLSNAAQLIVNEILITIFDPVDNLSKSANLRAHLVAANLPFINLSSLNLSRTHLSFAKLQSTKLIGTQLQHTNLAGANFMYAVLDGADFRGATLSIVPRHTLDKCFLSKYVNDYFKGIVQSYGDQPFLNIAFAESAKGATFDDETLDIMSKNPEVYKHLCDDLYKELKRRATL